ncbi:hypothetical protein MHZ36_13880 [Staphylococcus sp. ACRSN]|nr:hypothetical protein [Staphylococcus sp. ACRSN]MCG7340348.1 hypothetical protein [Staphylococcus sp. ACRSN]
MRQFELRCIIENIELELEFQDMTEAEENEKRKDLKQVKAELQELESKA